MTSGLFIVILKATGAAPQYWGPGTEGEAKDALAALEASMPAPEGVEFEWGIAELMPPEGSDVSVDPSAGWITSAIFGQDSEPSGGDSRYYGPFAQADAHTYMEWQREEPQPGDGEWREVEGTAYELQGFPS